jgi:dimethylargininase
MLIALTRAVPPSITRCELTHLVREPIDLDVARVQHRRYEEALSALGFAVQRLPAEPDLPDSVFVEDMAVVLREVAIVARPGAESRRAECPSVAEALGAHRRLAFIEPPGTLDGGDVLSVGSRLFVGLSGRTNEEAIRQLRAIVSPLGYEAHPVPVSGCLHLKSAVTQVAPGAVLLNPARLDAAAFAGFERIDVHPEEPLAANALWLGEVVLFPSAYPRTLRRLEERGLAVHVVDAGELAKAEGGLTCCSLLIRA